MVLTHLHHMLTVYPLWLYSPSLHVNFTLYKLPKAWGSESLNCFGEVSYLSRQSLTWPSTEFLIQHHESVVPHERSDKRQLLSTANREGKHCFQPASYDGHGGVRGVFTICFLYLFYLDMSFSIFYLPLKWAVMWGLRVNMLLVKFLFKSNNKKCGESEEV